MTQSAILHGPYDFPYPSATKPTAIGQTSRRSAKAKALAAIRNEECDCAACGARGETIPLPEVSGHQLADPLATRALTSGWTWYSPGLGKPTYIVLRGGAP